MKKKDGATVAGASWSGLSSCDNQINNNANGAGK